MGRACVLLQGEWLMDFIAGEPWRKDFGTGPCRGCEERHLACHSRCDKYNKWKAEYDRASELKRQNEEMHRYTNKH